MMIAFIVMLREFDEAHFYAQWTRKHILEYSRRARRVKTCILCFVNSFIPDSWSPKTDGLNKK